MRTQNAAYLRFTALGIVMILMFFLQTVPGLLPEVGGALPVILLPFVVVTAMMEREVTGAIFGLAAGLLMDLFTANIGAFHAVSLMIIGCICGLFVSYLLTVSLRSALVLYGGSALLYFTAMWLIYYVLPGYERAGSHYISHYIPLMLYSAVFLIPLYFVIRLIERKMTGKS